MQKFATQQQQQRPTPQSDHSPGNDRKKNRIKRSDNPTEKRKFERRQNEKDLTKTEESDIGSPSLIIPFKNLKKQTQDKMLILGTPEPN